MPQLSSQKQQPLIIVLVAIVIVIGGLIYRNYFQQAPEVTVPQPFSTLVPLTSVPQIPQDLFANDVFLKLQTYQPVVAPEPSLRSNPFAAP